SPGEAERVDLTMSCAVIDRGITLWPNFVNDKVSFSARSWVRGPGRGLAPPGLARGAVARAQGAVWHEAHAGSARRRDADNAGGHRRSVECAAPLSITEPYASPGAIS